MVYFESYKNDPINATIYGKTIEYRKFYGEPSDKTLKDFEKSGITPYHFFIEKDYNNNIYTIEQDDYNPHSKNISKNIILELYEYFKDIAPKKRLILYLFYLNGRKPNFPLFDPDIINISNFIKVDLDLIKKYKNFDYNDVLYILSNCNLEICEYLEKQFQICNLPTKKNQANEFLNNFIKNNFILGIQNISSKFKIDINKIISKSITTKSFDTLIVMYSSISKVQREKYNNQIIKLMPKLIGNSSITVDFLKLIEPIAWNEYTSNPSDGFSNYQINQTSILGFVGYNTPIPVIDYIADKLKPELITATYYSHSRYYSIYTLYIHNWDRNDIKSSNIIKKLIEIYQNSLIKIKLEKKIKEESSSEKSSGEESSGEESSSESSGESDD
jgi:hypothetical protein